MARILRVCLAGIALVMPLVVTQAAGAEPATRNVLNAGQQLVAGTSDDALTTPDNIFDLTVYSYHMELDQHGPMNTGVWATDDQAKPHRWNADRTILRMQRNGNLVLWTSKHVKMWESGTRGTGYRFELRRGGNMVIVNSHDKVVWASHTTAIMLQTGDTLRSGHRLTSRWGYWFHPVPYSSLTMQRDGNLVYRCRGRVAWATNTHARGSELTMQRDGNLLVRGPGGKTLWRSHTRGTGPDTFLNSFSMELQTTRFRTVWSANRGPAADPCI